MRFRILGPLAVEDDATTVSLGGVRQRAALGWLLLHVNQIVASSTLLRALWSDESRPVSARKILHNAVWRLRAALVPAAGSALPRLETRAPGYILQVDPAEVDLLRFRDAVAEGRRRLAAGDAEAAAVLLENALRLWRGPVLADLVEQGLSWPELDAVNEARADAQEDWFDAELKCGRHHVILGELHALVNGGALRERACGQLMLALYRCGRQAEALEVYARMRDRLIEKLGLEPGQELRRLQHAILNHEPALAAPTRPVTVRQPAPRASAAPERAVPTPSTSTPVPLPAPVVTLLGPSRAAGTSRNPVSVTPARIPLQRGAPGRRQVSVLMVRSVPTEKAALEQMDEILAATAAGVCAEVERAGGVVATSIGSTSVAVFGLPDADADDAKRAVRAAAAMRDRFGPESSVRAAITTGMLRLSDSDAIPNVVAGVLVDHCQQLLAGAGGGEIRVCGATRRATRSAFVSSPVDGVDDCWLVRAAPSAVPTPDNVPLVDRDSEMTLISKVVERAGHRSRPHLLTVLGDPGTGKTRLLAEVRNRFRATALPGDLPLRERPLAVHATLLGARCGITLDDGPTIARAKLGSALGDRQASTEDLIERLLPLFDATSARPSPAVLPAWAQMMTELYRDAPLVVTVDDLHRVVEGLLDAVRDLVTTPRPIPLCVVVSGRPSLLDRCPDWGGGVAHSVTITLDPLTDEAIDRIFEHLVSGIDGDAPQWLANALNGCTDREVSDRRDCLRRLLRSSTGFPPE